GARCACLCGRTGRFEPAGGCRVCACDPDGGWPAAVSERLFMKELTFGRALTGWAMGLFWALAAQAAGLQVTDDRGVTVELARPPQRIVSLLPSLTETVCELGQCHRLVGVDRYSNYPASVQALPTTGGGIDPNIEAIV